MKRFSTRDVILLFARVGSLTFGGGDPAMAVLHKELVVSRKWLSLEQYGLAFGLARITPGTNMLAFCAGAGWQLSGWLGAMLTVLSASIPSAFVIVWFTYAYDELKSSPWAMAAIGGMLAAAVGLMAAAAYQLLRRQWKRPVRLRCLVIFTAAVALSLGLSMSPIQVLGAGALAGFLWRTPGES